MHLLIQLVSKEQQVYDSVLKRSRVVDSPDLIDNNDVGDLPLQPPTRSKKSAVEKRWVETISKHSTARRTI